MSRVANEVAKFFLEKEIKLEKRKRYLHQAAEDSGSPNTDEDLIHFHEYAAESGEAQSQVTMGNLYLIGGHGLNVSYESAVEYFREAANNEDPRGVALYGFMYEKGFGVEKDDKKALSLYETAAEKQDGFAYARLGKAYLGNALGLKQDLKSAEHYFTLATKSGSSLAWYGLGQIALMQKEEKKALKYLSIAVQKGSGIAAVTLGEIQMQEKMTCQQAVKTFGLAFKWSELVTRMLSQAYQHYALGNITHSLKLYESLAWAGIEEAQANAAYIYDVILENHDVAKTYYELSAEQGNAHAHKVLGDYHYPRNLNLSHTAFRRAAEMQHHEAMFNLAYMYQHGEGI